MPDLPETIKQNISFIVGQAGSLACAAGKGLPDGEYMRRAESAMPEISLMALVTADELERRNSPDSFMMENEIAQRLRDIAFLCLDVQESADPVAVREMITILGERADSTAGMAGLPPYQPPEELWLEPVESSDPSATGALAPAGGENGNTEEWLKRTVRVLRELLASLVLERDQLVNVELRDIQTAYMRELGGLEAEAYQAECDVRLLKAKLEMMQASVNREEPVNLEDIAKQLRIQLEKFQQELDELTRRIKEADEYARKRERQRTTKAESDGAEHQDESTRDATEVISEKQADGPKPTGSEETEEQELKRLYRMIVKAMHPDLHPDQDEATKDLFKRAILAYKEFDLKTLREIAAMLAGEDAEDAENPVEALLKERGRLLELIRGIRAEIRAVKSRYPYTLKVILDDPVRLAETKRSLQNRIERAKRAADAYRQRIEEMERQNG